MNLEILSFGESYKFNPEVKTYGIRIFDALQSTPIIDLEENKSWEKVNNYFFDDLWSRDYKEYSWINKDDPYFSGTLKESWTEIKIKYPLMTKESLIGYYEARGHSEGRHILFDFNIAKKILTDFEKHKKNVEQVMIHCMKGKNRAPAIGIAMNEIYDWGIEGLKEKFPEYRRFVYDIMKEVGEEFRN